ncbi:hypothetical protein I7X12_09030 [Halosimplex litoreum]|uniref:HNH endonuclease n=1 Tax=Halosimplex litoreum TaxID=1198301 RepID=A0A7U3WAT0_9EURY|nr:hypothetical protein [Halosimplex litoreum]QPV64725.1 hypothetical protein I7X12_09030 [Halosimplex litoreum]
MATTESECIESLREAARRLGESPSKAQYEELGLTPAASTILRVVGGWNDAKERAGLSTSTSRGSRVAPKPEGVELPDEMSWEDLSQDQRWHYRNAEHNTERTLRRRARLRAWVNDRKRERGCVDCGESDPACLDFHHRDSAEKEMAVTDLITHGHGREALRREFEKCDVVCANCHRRRHDRRPAVVGRADGPRTKRERLRRWSHERRAERGCRRCSETDPVCLQFHHSDPDEKSGSVGQLISDGAEESEVRTEVDRCVVLCANCHRREHFAPPTVEENGGAKATETR